jgi:hypothetical protein
MFKLEMIAALTSLLLLPALRGQAQDAQVAPPGAATSIASQSVVLTSGSGVPADGYLPESGARRGAREHDGFFLRLSMGSAFGSTSYDGALGGQAVHYRTLGGGGATEVAVGHAVARNVILHANLSLAHLSGARKQGSQAYEEEDTSTLVGFVGLGATYYLMPVNMYATASVGLGGLSQTQGARHEDFESDTGLGTSLSLGKEWWVGQSGQWALGFAVSGSYYQAPFELEGVESTYRGYTGGLAFTSTYN